MIDYNYRDEFLADGTVKFLLGTDGVVTVTGNHYTVSNASVVLTNSEIESESFYIKQSLSSSGSLVYGSCEAAECGFTMHENISTLKGKTLRWYMYLNNDASTMIQLGVFKVDSDKLTADRTKREIKSYDAMYDIINADVKPWFDALQFPMTLEAFWLSFFDYLNVDFEYSALPNASMTVTRTIVSGQMSGADVIKAICEANGVFGTINNTGYFKFLTLSENIDSVLFPSDLLYPSNGLYPLEPNPATSEMPKNHYSALEFEDYMCEGITRLIVRENDDDVGGSVGEEGNTYIITGNFLMYGKTTAQKNTIAANIFNNIKNRYYRPCKVVCVGDATHELGDAIRIRTVYRGITTYILSREFKGIQAITDTYTAEGEQKYSVSINSVGNQLKQLAGRTASLIVDTEGIEARVESIEDGTASVITQLNSQISAKVSSTGGDESSFAWELNTTNFKLTSNSTNVFTCDNSGVKIYGSIYSIQQGAYASIVNGGLSMSDGSNGVISISGSTGYFVKGNNTIKIDPEYSGIHFENSTANKLLNLVGSNLQFDDNVLIHSGNIGTYAITPSNIGNQEVRYATSSQYCAEAMYSNNAGYATNAGTATSASSASSLSSGATITSLNMPSGSSTGASKTRTCYWKRKANVGDNDFVIVADA